MNIYKLFGEGGKGMLMNYMICLVVVGICKKIKDHRSINVKIEELYQNMI